MMNVCYQAESQDQIEGPVEARLGTSVGVLFAWVTRVDASICHSPIQSCVQLPIQLLFQIGKDTLLISKASSFQMML